MAEFNCDIDIPTPHKTIGASALLNDETSSHHGYIKKLKADNKGLSAKLKRLLSSKFPFLTILNNGCLYCFTNDQSKEPREAYTLFGYNKIVRALDMKSEKQPWVFQIIHAAPDRETLTFAATTEKEMIQWMKAIKVEMLRANGKSDETIEVQKNIRSTGDGKESLGDFVELPIYEDAASVFSSLKDRPPETLAIQNKSGFGGGGTLDDYDSEGGDVYLELNEGDEVDTGSPKREESQAAGSLTTDLRNALEARTKTTKIWPWGKSTPKIPQKAPTVHEVEQAETISRDERGPALPPNRPVTRSQPDGASLRKASADSGSTAKTSQESPRKISSEGTSKRPEVSSKPKTFSKPKSKETSSDQPSSSTSSKNQDYTKEQCFEDPTLYWKLKDFSGNKEEAISLLTKIGQEGVYLIRDGGQNAKVLVVFDGARTRKFLVKQDNKQYSITDSDRFDSMEDMLYHYTSKPLPNMNLLLTTPYKLAMMDD